MKQTPEITGFRLERQVTNQQGFLYYIEVSFRFKKGPSSAYLLPVQPSLPLSDSEAAIQFNRTEGYNRDSQGLAFLIETVYRCSPQARVVDAKGQMRGVLFNTLFFYSEDASIFSNTPIHPSIAFNPLLLNQTIQENKL